MNDTATIWVDLVCMAPSMPPILWPFSPKAAPGGVPEIESAQSTLLRVPSLLPPE